MLRTPSAMFAPGVYLDLANESRELAEYFETPEDTLSSATIH